MKKEKTVRTYQRRTKSGKLVTVRQHTAKYDAAEALKEAAKKKGAGDELENLKKKSVEKPKMEKPVEDVSDYGFTADEFKQWYHWDTESDPKNAAAKKVEKALKKQMGAKAYKKYFDELTDNYSARGHNKAFKSLLSEKSKEDRHLEQRSKDIAKMVEDRNSQMRKVGIDPDKRLTGKKATEAKKELLSKGFSQKKDEDGTYLMKGKEVYHYIPGGTLMGGAHLDKITGGKNYDRAKELFGAVTPKKETKGSKGKSTSEFASYKISDLHDSVTSANPNGNMGEFGFFPIKSPKGVSLYKHAETGVIYSSPSAPKKWGEGKLYKSMEDYSRSSKKQVLQGETRNMGASAIKYNGKTYMVMADGKVETVTGRKVGKALSDKILSKKSSKTSKKNSDGDYSVSKEEFSKMSPKKQDAYFRRMIAEKKYTNASGTPLGAGARSKAMQREAKRFRDYYGIDSEGNVTSAKHGASSRKPRKF